MRRFAWLVAYVIAFATFASIARAQDLARMAPSEIEALQRRLADSGCYRGPYDRTASGALTKAIKACPIQVQQLRIETGMHVAAINKIGVDRACRIAATTSDDKTLRLWSLPDGRLIRTLRMPVGPGDIGKANAVAVSPDGRFVAVGGSVSNGGPQDAIYIFDAVKGAVVSRIGGYDDVIGQLAISPDGRWLAATLGSGGLRIYDTLRWKQAVADRDYGDGSEGAAFGPDGRLYTVADDGKLRVYAAGPGFGKAREVMLKGGRQPVSVSVDPRAELVAVGFIDSTKVDVYDAKTLDYRFAADTEGIDHGELGQVAWRADGAALVAGGGYHSYLNGALKDPIVTFGRDGSRRRPDIPLAYNIENIQPCGTGFAVAAGDPAFGLLGPDGEIRLWQEGVAPDMRGKVADGFAVSADAKKVRFGLVYGGGRPVAFDLVSASLTDAGAIGSDFALARTEGLPVQNWRDRTDTTFRGKAVAFDQNETAHSLAVRQRSTGFVLGTNWFLRAFDAVGRQLWEQLAPGEAWGVNLSADGRIIVAAYGDGTIRWHRWSDGQELLALFVNRQTKAWVAWTPSGYYSASPGGEDMIGWQLNRGWNQVPDFFPAEKFRAKYSRPDIVERVLDTLDEAEALRLADLARPKKPEAAPIIETLPPVISILAPADGTEASKPDIKIDYIVRSPSGTPVDAVDALIDGKPIGARGFDRFDDDMKKCIAATRGLGRTEGALQGCRGSLTVSLPPGTSEIGLFARAAGRTSEIANVRVTRLEGAKRDELLKPKLYALVVGISDYVDPNYKLEFPAKDAHDFAAALENQRGGLYGDVQVKLLVDRQATGSTIREGLDWLTQQVTDRDVGIVYLSGHGDLDAQGRFYFLAADSEHDHLRATALPREDVADALAALAGKAVLFLDACHSGTMAEGGKKAPFDFNTVVSDFAHSERGIVVFAASTGRQVSLENEVWGNGAFTKALVEGLGLPGHPGLADYRHTGSITPALLDAYVADRVKQLTDGRQSPVMNSTAPDFPLAVVR